MGDAAGAREDFIPYRVAGPAHEVVNMLKPDRDALHMKKNLKPGSTPSVVSLYVYQTVNAIGQRTALRKRLRHRHGRAADLGV
jgi:hypothetical protein